MRLIKQTLFVLLVVVIHGSGLSFLLADVEQYNGPALPFSDAVRAGDLLFLSGRIASHTGDTEIEDQTRAVLTDIRAILRRYQADMDDIVKCTVFLVEMSEWARMNDVYISFFDGKFPARSAVGVSALARDARIEIECIAMIPVYDQG